MKDLTNSDIKLMELYKQSIRECMQYGFYQEALESFRVVMEDCPEIGFEIYWDMIGFWQECYDMTINVPNHGRQVISFVPKHMREKYEESEENFE